MGRPRSPFRPPRVRRPSELTRSESRERNKGIITHSPIGPDYIAGGVSGIPSTVLNDFGDWRPWLPTFERQSTRIFDSMACVSFSALNCLETIHKFRYGTEVNYSDRFLARASGTGRLGNTFRAVADTIRRDGLVDEGLYPWPAMAVWDTYYSDIPADVQAEAREFLDGYEVGYEFITYFNDDILRKELRKGPLQISIGSQVVEAHAVELLHVEPDGTKWVFDHYGTGLTSLHPERRVFSAMRYHYIKKNETNSPMIIIPNNALVFMAEPPGKYGLHVDGKMYVDDTVKLLAQWVSRNEKNGVFSGGPTRSVTAYDFNSFPQFDLKNNPL